MVSDPGRDTNFQASALLRWPDEVLHLEDKEIVAERAAALVQAGQTIGIGSGSATYLALWAIGRRVERERLNVRVTVSSYETETAALELGLRTVPLGRTVPDWGIDGADEVDPDGRLLKGRGGAMFHEKILWASCKRMYLAIDPSKHVERLGMRFPVPVEVHRCAVDLVSRALAEVGATDQELRLAGGKDGPVITESGNLIVDARFEGIPPGLQDRLKAISGVIETGLFEGYTYETL